MRITYLIELVVISVFLIAMIIASMFKRKKNLEKKATSVFNVFLAIIVPLSGNALAFLTDSEQIANIGYMIMLLGDCFLIYNLFIFVMDYCEFRFRRSLIQYVVLGTLTIITGTILTNPLYGFVFGVQTKTLDDGTAYFALEPHNGMLLGFCLLQALFILIIAILIDKCLKISSAYHEKYIVIMISMFICMAFLFYVFSEMPVNNSLIGYVLCGCLLYLFTYIYKPFFIRRRLADSVVEFHTDGIIFYDTDVNALYANDRAFKILGLETGDPNKCTDKLLEITGGADLGVDFDISASFRDKDKETTYLNITHRLMKDKRNKEVGSFFSIHDDTEQVNLNEERKYLATHDKLTGLSNRFSFEDQVNDILESNPDTPYYMIVSDINDFKLINDVFGRAKADEILIKIARDIEKFSHPGSALCRWRGDIFCAFAKKSLIDLDTIEKLVKDSWADTDIINSPLVIHVGVFETTSKDQDEKLTVNSMVDRAQLAIASIKNDYNRCIAVYDTKLRDDKLWEQRITSELANAIATGQIIPYLQPQYRADGRLEGGEVLVRWNHPTEGLLSPFKFIPVFEKNGLIATIDNFIWEEACKILANWAKRTDGYEKLSLSINISPKDFYFLDIFEVITGLVEKYGIKPEQLHLEITESSVMNNAVEHIKVINNLREYGFTVEMDDFGSGYSSLNMLKDMPVDILKIDMVFLGKTADFRKSKIILNSIVDMANNLDMPQITEGVETKEQFDMLKNMGCKLFQGYFFSKPVPLEEFEKLPLIWK